MKRFSNAPIKTWNGKDDIRIPLDVKGENTSTEFRHLIQAVINNCEIKTVADSRVAMRICQAVEEAEGKDYIEIEEGDHDWLKKVAESNCPRIFRSNGAIVYDFIKEGYEKKAQPKVAITEA